MTTFLGSGCVSEVLVLWRSAKSEGSPSGFSISPSPRSSPCRLSCRLSVSSASSATRPTSRIKASAFLEQREVSTTARCEGTSESEAASPSVVTSFAAGAAGGVERSNSESSRDNSVDRKAWKATRAARKTSRRRALAICLALAGLGQQGSSSSGLAQDQSADSPARDLIRVSQGSSAQVPASRLSSTANGERYGNLVTVSTGSDTLNNASKVKGLPSWMGGNYHLCMGDGFHVQLPSDWHMYDTAGQLYGTVLRYEDKEDPSTNVVVLSSPTSKSQTGNLGKPEDWIREQAYLLSGKNEPIQFQSDSEGTHATRMFPKGSVSIAKVLRVDKPYKQGLTYYNYEILTKQGEEPGDGLHELVSAVVNDGNLYMCRVQTGEGRWQQDSHIMAQRIVDSFQITGFKIPS